MLIEKSKLEKIHKDISIMETNISTDNINQELRKIILSSKVDKIAKNEINPLNIYILNNYKIIHSIFEDLFDYVPKIPKSDLIFFLRHYALNTENLHNNYVMQYISDNEILNEIYCILLESKDIGTQPWLIFSEELLIKSMKTKKTTLLEINQFQLFIKFLSFTPSIQFNQLIFEINNNYDDANILKKNLISLMKNQKKMRIHIPKILHKNFIENVKKISDFQ